MSEQYQTSKWALGIYSELGLTILGLIALTAMAFCVFVIKPIGKLVAVLSFAVLAITATLLFAFFAGNDRPSDDFSCPSCGARLAVCECDDSSTWLNPH